MELKLIRTKKTKDSTIGKLYVNGKLECYTLEETAKILKAGKYKVTIAWSPSLKKITPRLLNTGKRKGILIHSGNTIADTEGCILVGHYVGLNNLILSRNTYRKLMDKMLVAYYNKEEGNIEIIIEDVNQEIPKG